MSLRSDEEGDSVPRMGVAGAAAAVAMGIRRPGHGTPHQQEAVEAPTGVRPRVAHRVTIPPGRLSELRAVASEVGERQRVLGEVTETILNLTSRQSAIMVELANARVAYDHLEALAQKDAGVEGQATSMDLESGCYLVYGDESKDD